MANIDELVNELAQVKRQGAIAKRDSNAQVAHLKSQNGTLLSEIHGLKDLVKAAQDAVGRYTVCACLRDATVQIADLKQQNHGLAQENQQLKHLARGGQDETAQHKQRAGKAAEQSERHSRDADKARADAAASAASLETERAESARVRALLEAVVRVARDFSADRDSPAKLRHRLAKVLRTAEGKA